MKAQVTPVPAGADDTQVPNSAATLAFQTAGQQNQISMMTVTIIHQLVHMTTHSIPVNPVAPDNQTLTLIDTPVVTM